MRPLTFTVVVVLALGCSTGHPGDVARELPANMSPVVNLEVYDRSSEPAGNHNKAGRVLVKVAAALDDEVWRAWGPTVIPAEPAPEVPAGSQVILVWVGGTGLTVSGYLIGDAGRLIIVGEYKTSKLSKGCSEVDWVEGRTHVFAVSDPAVQPGMAIGEPDIINVVGPDRGC